MLSDIFVVMSRFLVFSLGGWECGTLVLNHPQWYLCHQENCKCASYFFSFISLGMDHLWVKIVTCDLLLSPCSKLELIWQRWGLVSMVVTFPQHLHHIWRGTQGPTLQNATQSGKIRFVILQISYIGIVWLLIVMLRGWKQELQVGQILVFCCVMIITQMTKMF